MTLFHDLPVMNLVLVSLTKISCTWIGTQYYCCLYNQTGNTISFSKTSLLAVSVFYLSALNADSVSMNKTFPSKPPLCLGRVACTLNMIQNWVLPHPEGPAIYIRGKSQIIITHPQRPAMYIRGKGQIIITHLQGPAIYIRWKSQNFQTSKWQRFIVYLYHTHKRSQFLVRIIE